MMNENKFSLEYLILVYQKTFINLTTGCDCSSGHNTSAKAKLSKRETCCQSNHFHKQERQWTLPFLDSFSHWKFTLLVRPKICYFLKIWWLSVSRLLPFILRTNFWMSSKEKGMFTMIKIIYKGNSMHIVCTYMGIISMKLEVGKRNRSD